MSAFNLTYENASKRKYSVECIFQSSKVFQSGGPYKDLLDVTSLKAKRDSRLKESGHLIGFSSNGKEWSTEPKTLFYDWVYINALDKKIDLVESVMDYQAFTDIEFNPQKSINCQAYSVALYISLKNKGLLNDVLKDPEIYKELISSFYTTNTTEDESKQPRLL